MPPSPSARAAETPSANPQRPDDPAKQDSADAKSESSGGAKRPDLFVIVAQPREGAQLVELHAQDTAQARVSLLTHNSRQHRKEAEEADEAPPEGGGSHEINRSDIHVYKLNATEVTDF